MSVAKYSIELEWKEFNVCLETVHAWMQANAGEHYRGSSADSKLRLHFVEEPSQEVKDDVAAYWEALDEESDEAANYMSAADRAAEVEAKKASGKAKLAALGLTAEEIAALVG